jgi:ribosomal protein S16
MTGDMDFYSGSSILLQCNFNLILLQKRFEQHRQVIEQLGTYDPHANQHNERLVALNFERVRYWLGRGVDTSDPVAELLGKDPEAALFETVTFIFKLYILINIKVTSGILHHVVW